MDCSALIVSIEGKRVGATQVGITAIENAPVRRREIVATGRRRGQVRVETQHRLAVTPFASCEAISGSDKERMSVGGNPAGCPDARTCCTRMPGAELMRLVETYPYDPAAIIAAVPEM